MKSTTFSLNYGEVVAIFEDMPGTFWIGTTGGLDRFNPQAGTFQVEEPTRGHLVAAVVEDQQGNLWAGTWGGVLRRARQSRGDQTARKN